MASQCDATKLNSFKLYPKTTPSEVSLIYSLGSADGTSAVEDEVDKIMHAANRLSIH
jgi:hypothetical protein